MTDKQIYWYLLMPYKLIVVAGVGLIGAKIFGVF